MPNTTSAKKALRQNSIRRERNVKKKEAYKEAVKLFRKLIAAKKLDEAKAQLPRTYQLLDKAAKGKVIEKNKASRLKSQLAKHLKV
jgi:small subunit ribosomal protein S20